MKKKNYIIPWIIAVVLSLLGLLLFVPNMHILMKNFNTDEPLVEDSPVTTQNKESNLSSNLVSRTEYTPNSTNNSSSIIKVHSGNTNKDKLYKTRPEKGAKFAELAIPKLKLTLPIYEGTTNEDLKKGVGHFIDSVLPGETDNSVLSGHRDTVFGSLGKLKKGDSLVVTTSNHTFKYKIKKIRIVDKDDKTVIVPKPRATLTLTTCYPFVYIGHAPKRYIIEAILVS